MAQDKDTGTFDLRQTTATLGVVNIQGYAAGDSLTIEQDGDTYNSEAGADGFTDRIKNNATRLIITILLRQGSPINDQLSALHIADRTTNKGVVPFVFKDLNGNTLVTAKSAWITKPATIVNGNEAKQREWVIHTGSSYVLNVGGNA